MRRALLFILLLLSAMAPLTAQAPDAIPDTLSALAAAEVPARDRVDIARRVFGLQDLPPPPASAPQWQPGDALSFNVTNEEENRSFAVEATLRAGGEHIWLWVERGVAVDPARLRALAQLFDGQIYGPLRALFGGENSLAWTATRAFTPSSPAAWARAWPAISPASTAGRGRPSPAATSAKCSSSTSTPWGRKSTSGRWPASPRTSSST